MVSSIVSKYINYYFSLVLLYFGHSNPNSVHKADSCGHILQQINSISRTATKPSTFFL